MAARQWRDCWQPVIRSVCIIIYIRTYRNRLAKTFESARTSSPGVNIRIRAMKNSFCRDFAVKAIREAHQNGMPRQTHKKLFVEILKKKQEKRSQVMRFDSYWPICISLVEWRCAIRAVCTRSTHTANYFVPAGKRCSLPVSAKVQSFIICQRRAAFCNKT